MQNKGTIAAMALMYVVCVGAPSVAWERPLVVFAGYLLLTLWMLYRWHSRADLVFYFTAALLGSVGDLVATSAGAWTYNDATHVIPAWLPLGWGIIGLFLRKASEILAIGGSR